MISHDEAMGKYEAYFGNRLSRAETKAFHAHLNDCEECKVRLRTMKASMPWNGFTLVKDADAEAKLQKILWKNRLIMYAVLVVMICFFLFFKFSRRS